MGILTAPPLRSRATASFHEATRRRSIRADSRLAFRCLNDVRHEEGPRHRADAAGVRADPRGNLVHAVRNVTHQTSLAVLALHAAHAHVEDDSAGATMSAVMIPAEPAAATITSARRT